MIAFETEIDLAYRRALDSLGDAVENLDSDCLTTKDVIFAHFAIANHFYLENNEQGMGGVGPRDIGLLQ